MKPKLIVRLGIVLALGVLAAYVLAQSVAPVAIVSASASQLDDAIALLASGKPQEAKELLATIDKGDPAYGVAQCYNALCLYELNDKRGFLKVMESAAVQEAIIPQELQENLAFKQIDALFQYRRFEDIFPKLQAFQEEYPASARLNAVAEYRLAALFERGIKKTYEAVQTQDTNRFTARWTEGRANLEQFLSLAASFPATNYSLFPKRRLKEDLWVARVTLGDEQAALEEIPMQETAAREKFALLRAQLYPKIQPERIDQNLQRLADFIREFPASKSRARVEYEIARLYFHAAERLWKEAHAAERAGDAKSAEEKNASASRYYRSALPFQSRIVADQSSGIEESDVFELQKHVLCGYYWEKDYASLKTQIDSLIGGSTPGDLRWMFAKVFDAVLMFNGNPSAVAEPAAVLDGVLAFGFRNKPNHDSVVIWAAKWRTYVALASGDKEKAAAIVRMVQQANCTKNLKAEFLKTYESVAALQAN